MFNSKDWYKNNPENPYTTKVSKRIPSGFSMSTISSFKSMESKRDVCRAKDCMKRLYEKFYESLREHAIKIIKFKKKKIKFENEYLEDKKYFKVRDHCHYTEEYRVDGHSICILKYSVPRKFQ